MERPRLIPQLYGYAVCLVAVITILIASGGIIDGAFDAATPEMSREMSHQLRTFEMYKEHREEQVVRRETRDRTVGNVTPLPPDDVLRRSYEDERRYAIAHARFQGLRKILTSVIVLLLAAAFFFAHWRWLKSLNRAETP